MMLFRYLDLPARKERLSIGEETVKMVEGGVREGAEFECKRKKEYT